MGLFGKSLKELRAEQDALQAEIDAKAMRLEGALLPVNQVVNELMPLTTELVAVQRRILLKTPRRELVARAKELERLTASPSPHPFPDDILLRSELARIRNHLDDPSREAVTLRFFLVLVAIAAAMVYVPRFIADWLAR